MKIIHLTTVDMSLRLLLLAQLRAAVDQGHEVIGVSAPGPHVAYLESLGIRHIALEGSTRGMNPAADLRSARHLWRILRAERPDVLHTHNPKPGWYGRVVGRLSGVPLVVNTVHGLYATPDDPIRRRLAVYGLEAIASRFSHVELVQNPEDLALLTRLRLVPTRRIALLGNGVDLDRFRPGVLTEVEREEERAALGIHPYEVVIGTVGRLVAEKGYQELFAVARNFPDNARLVVVGPSEPAKADAVPQDAIDEAQRAGVVFLGHRDQVERLYPLFDVFVLASHREGYPRAAMEAAATGLPIVATDIRGCRQVVDHGRNGLVVPVHNVERLGEAITTLIDDPELRRAMGSAGRAKAETDFDEAAVVKIVMSAYQGSLSGHGRLALKRAVDIVVGAAALVTAAPLIALVGALVRLRLGRPVLFTQQRLGLDGETFTMLKFRTMADTRDANGQLLSDEERLTPVGRLLRSWSLDELPELVNVLRGEMSLIGPRPLLPQYLHRYSSRQARRHEMRPGITGWAQVNGRNLTTWDERLEMDVWYIDNWSLRLDFKILLATLHAVRTRTGIAHSEHASMPEFDGRGSDSSGSGSSGHS